MKNEQIDAIAFSGEIYDPNTPAIVLHQERVKRWIARYNKLGTSPLGTFGVLKIKK